MISIIEWFKQVEPSYQGKLYEKIISSRNQLILEALKKYSFFLFIFIFLLYFTKLFNRIKESHGSLGTSNSIGNNLSTLPSANIVKRNSLVPLSPAANTTASGDDKRNSLRSRLT